MVRKKVKARTEAEKESVSYFRCKHRGSLLLEIAIGLSVLGVISGFFVTKSIMMSRVGREQTTKNNIEIVASALATYLAANKRLPRPTAFSQASSSPLKNGFESNDKNCAVGYVPFRTLGIIEKNAKDGQGRYLIYAVDPELTDNFDSIYFDRRMAEESLTIPRYFCDTNFIPAIRIQSHAENKDMVAFVLDTADNIPRIQSSVIGDSDDPFGISEKDISIMVTPSVHTFWVRRNFLLVHYLKGCPCEKENPQNELDE